jgi:tRNA-specific 2-thiouridylase
MDNMLAVLRKQVSTQLKGTLASQLPAERESIPFTDDFVATPGSLSWVPPATVWAASEEIAVLLSGGVDSSVALHLLLEAGHRCRAFYLRIWLEDEQVQAARGVCPWEEDWEYCTAVCQQAGVPLEGISLQREYSEHVAGYLLAEAAAGRTPNPDIMCNSRIKFGVFHDRVGRHFRKVASGHYAQVSRAAGGDGETVRLLRSADAHKDQTYFLSQLRQVRPGAYPVSHK